MTRSRIWLGLLVKTGLPGDVFVSLTSELAWPERFAVNLPPRPSG